MDRSSSRFHIFPYRQEEPRNGRPPVDRPTVDLKLQNNHQRMRIRALVDTGAPFCIFSRAVADLLEIDMGLGRGENRMVHILGGAHEARVGHVLLELPPFEGVTWEAEACFLYADLQLSFAGVLGQEGFLDRWVASFNYYGRYFVIEEVDSFAERLGVDPAAVYEEQFDSDWSRPTTN